MPAPEDPGVEDPLTKRITQQTRRKLRAREHHDQSTWFGLGMYGMIGWSVAIPTLLGVAAGIWIDSRWPSRYSWTLMLLTGGLLLGCWNAWFWVSIEQRAIGNGNGSKSEKKDSD